MIEGLVALACRFPAVARFPPAAERKAAEGFARAAIPCPDAQAYLSFCMALSLLAGALAFLAAIALFSDAALGAGAALCAFGILFLFFLNLPLLLAARREQALEAELPFVLRELAIYLDVGLPYEKCIARLAASEYGIAREFSAARNAVAAGASLQEAFASLSASTGSLALKRALFLISSSYETGRADEALRRMADELAAAQLSSMRSAAGRFSLLAIAFIAASALIPSFFTVLASVSPLVLDKPVQEWQAWLAFLIVFPSLDALALCAIFLLLPPAAGSGGGSGRDALGACLESRGIRMGARSFALALAALSILLSAACLLLGSASLALLCICLAPAAYALAAYSSSAAMARSERMLPDALYSAAATHKLLSPERMLSLLSRGGFGAVSDAFALALARQKAGDSFRSSMAAAARLCPTPLCARAFSLLVVAYETGADMHAALRDTAQDIASFFALLRERAALLSIQRCTVLASCALLVPFILGTVMYLAPSLSGTASAGASMPALSQGARPDASFLASLALSCQIYLVLNAALSALMLALLEGEPARAALYFSLCAPLALLSFSLASSSAVALA